MINDIEKRPKFAHELLKRLCDDVLLLDQVQHETVPQARFIVVADAWGSLPILFKDFEEFALPYIERLDDGAQRFGIRSVGQVIGVKAASSSH